MRVTIDQAVGSALLQLMNDASPVVRMVRELQVCAKVYADQ